MEPRAHTFTCLFPFGGLGAGARGLSPSSEAT
jgi:hypothetical protein